MKIRILFSVFFLLIFFKLPAQPSKENRSISPSSNPYNFTLIDSIPIQIPAFSNSGGLNGLLYNGTHFYTKTGSENEIFIYDTLGNYINNIITQDPSGERYRPTGFTFDGNDIFVSHTKRNTLYSYGISKIQGNSLDFPLYNTPNFYNDLVYNPDFSSNYTLFWGLNVGMNAGLFYINASGNHRDTLLPNLQNFEFWTIALDTFTYASQHLIVSNYSLFRGHPEPTLRWLDPNTKTFTNDIIYLGAIFGTCKNVRGSFITPDYKGTGPKLIMLVSDKNGESHVIYVFDLFTPTTPLPPVNNSICKAALVEIDSAAVLFNTIGATYDSIIPPSPCFNQVLDRTAWFKIPITRSSFTVGFKAFTPDSSCTPFFPYQIDAFTISGAGGCQGLPISIGCNTPGAIPVPRLTFSPIVPGDTLYVRIDGPVDPGFNNIHAFSLPTVSRDFELYNNSHYIAQLDDEWFLDSNLVLGNPSDDANISSNYSQSGDYSLKLDGSVQPRYNLFDLSSSSHRIGFSVYIPSGNNAYFELLNEDSTLINSILFDSTGHGFNSLNSNDFSFIFDRWFDVEYYVDLDGDEIQLWIDNEFIFSDAFPTNLINPLPIVSEFYFNPQLASPINNEFYIDDMQNAPSAMPDPIYSLSNFSLQIPSSNANLVVDNGQIFNNLFRWESSSHSVPNPIEYNLRFYEEANGNLFQRLEIQINDSSQILDINLIDSLFDRMNSTLGIDTLRLKWDVEASNAQQSKFSYNGPFDITMYEGTHIGALNASIESQIKIYPNPAEEFLYILSALEEAEWRLIDINGALQLSGKAHKGEKRINTQKLIPGFYFLQINSNDQQVIRKVIVR